MLRVSVTSLQTRYPKQMKTDVLVDAPFQNFRQTLGLCARNSYKPDEASPFAVRLHEILHTKTGFGAEGFGSDQPRRKHESTWKLSIPRTVLEALAYALLLRKSLLRAQDHLVSRPAPFERILGKKELWYNVTYAHGEVRGDDMGPRDTVQRFASYIY